MMRTGNSCGTHMKSTCPSRTRKPNPHIKTKDGDKVYSRESYAQEMYDMLTAHDASHWTITDCN